MLAPLNHGNLKENIQGVNNHTTHQQPSHCVLIGLLKLFTTKYINQRLQYCLSLISQMFCWAHFNMLYDLNMCSTHMRGRPFSKFVLKFLHNPKILPKQFLVETVGVQYLPHGNKHPEINLHFILHHSNHILFKLLLHLK
jgi:hypothetical protein